MAKVRDRIGNRPLYISVDIDVLDPAHAPVREPRRRAASPAANSWRSSAASGA
ncbi:guanidinobutyrase [Arthrobacter sp. Hiyo4]|nr:guanidinobutyrase [Arthrobacter sp. Hiyo4]